MLKASLRSLLAHKLRLGLTALAVILGVAFVAGSLIFTDTIGQTFRDLFRQTSADITISAQSATSRQFQGVQAPAPPVPDALLRVVRAVEGVAAAEGQVLADGVRIVGPDGKVVGTPGAPGLGVDWSSTPGISPMRLTAGRPPQGAAEVAIDRVAADRIGLDVGERVRLLMPKGPPIEPRVTGIFTFGSSGNLAGATLTAFDRATAQRLLVEPSQWSAIGVAVEPGTSTPDLARRISRVAGGGYAVRTAQEQADDNFAQVEQALSFINIFLLVFAGVALFVGSFIILNTFSMLVAQRARELALMRAIGASRRQVTRSVLLEALAVGLVGSTAGLAAGIGLALLLQQVFAAVGLEIPTGDLVVSPRTVVWCYAVGVGVTMLAAYLPGRRASRVPPVAAMRDDVAMPQRSLRLRGLLGAAGAMLGVATLFGGFALDGGAAAALVGAGALLVLVGAAALSPVLSKPVVQVLGAGFPRAFGTVGRLSRDNAVRNPRRTAATASALMIGLALVGAIGVLAASTDESVDRIVDRGLGADYVVSDAIGTPFSDDVATMLRGIEGVGAVNRQRFGVSSVAGTTGLVTAVDPQAIGSALSATFVAGGAEGLGQAGVLVDEATAQAQGWQVGHTVTVTLPRGPQQLTIRGIYERSEFLGPLTVSLETFEAGGGDRRDNFVYVNAAPGADTAGVGERLKRALAPYPNVTLKDQAALKQQQRDQVRQFTTLIYALLALSVLIAALGIVNTLALSVIERTREIGLLRAVGMTRAQLRAMVRLEAVVIAVFGAVLGLVIGVGFGAALQYALRDNGIEVLRVPVGLLGAFLAVAALIGVLAAAWPARRAARLDVLRAITTE